jgi:hypothetical protein
MTCPNRMLPHRLSEGDLARISGGGGELTASVRTPPLQATVGVAFQGSRGSLTGAVTYQEGRWEAGIAAQARLGRATVEGAVRVAPGGAWGAQASLRIPLGR